jgi:hypothetical protein
MGVITYIPNKLAKPYIQLEFSLSVASLVLDDDFIMSDGTGSISLADQTDLGFLLAGALHPIIEEAQNTVIKERQAVEFSVESSFNSFYVTAIALDGMYKIPKSEMRISVFVDTYKNRLATFKNILNELVDFQAAYAS